MFLQQNLKIRRCLACKKRKKKCDIQDSMGKCSFCIGKGTDCKLESFEISKHINGKIIKHNTSKKKRKYELNKEIGKSLKPRSDLGNSDTCDGHNNLSSVGIRVIHIPVYCLDDSSSSPTIHQEIDQVKVLNDETILDTSFSLSNYILSGTRVKLLNLGACDVEKDRLCILNSNIVARKKEAMETLKAHKKSLPNVAKGFTKKLLHAVSHSVDDIDLEIDILSLKNVMFIADAAITIDINGERFANLPDFINTELLDILFGHFCKITREAESSSDSKMTFLKVVLPLIFGNITVLKCVLLLSYYHILENEILPNFDQFYQDMYSLHVEVLHELKSRLSYYSSVCCDHSFLIVHFLLTIEILNGAKTTLWKKLQGLTQTMILLRGGVYKLAESLTGLCLLKVMLIQICTEIDLDNDATPVSLPNLLHVLKTKTKFDFFDNFNYKYSLTLAELSPVVELYGRISMMNKSMMISFGPISFGSAVDYNSVDVVNMHNVLRDASNIKERLKHLEAGISALSISKIHEAQLLFAIHASEIFLYQTVYKQASICPNTILKVKDLLEDVRNIFFLLSSASLKELRSSCILTLPLFCLGVDILAHGVREWYINQLYALLKKTKRKMIHTIIFLLQKVWELNKDGSSFIEWKILSDIHCAYISMAC